MAWTDETIEVTVKLWAEGLSAEQISQHLVRKHQMKVTRNSVIGKINRLRDAANRAERNGETAKYAKMLWARNGVQTTKAARAKKSVQRKRKAAAKAGRPMTDEQAARLLMASVKPVGIEAEPVSETGKTLMELEPGECKFGVGQREGRHVFCGEKTGSRKASYCADHHRKCYVKPPPRKRQVPAARYAGRRLVAVH